MLRAADRRDDLLGDAELAVQMSSGSWVTWPGDGNPCGNSRWALATGVPERSKAIARDDVVPWSSARITVRSVMPGTSNSRWAPSR